MFIIVSEVLSLNTASWIGDSLGVIGEKTLQQITLPGTHDSDSYNLTNLAVPYCESTIALFTPLAQALNQPLDAVVITWSKCQDQTIYQQMKDGMRYFDVRATFDNSTGEWRGFHLLFGPTISEVLGNITQFLKEYPKEIVVVELSHFHPDSTAEEISGLNSLVIAKMGNFLHPVKADLNFTINSMVTSGRRALVSMESGNDNVNVWGGIFYNTYADDPDLGEMMKFNNATIKAFMAGTWPEQLFKISWTLTPNATTLENSLNSAYPGNLLALADTANKALPAFWAEIRRNNWRMGHILLIDHYETSAVLVTAMQSSGISQATAVNYLLVLMVALLFI